MDPDNESGYTTKGWTGPNIRSVPGLALKVGDYEGWHYHYFKIRIKTPDEWTRMYY